MPRPPPSPAHQLASRRGRRPPPLPGRPARPRRSPSPPSPSMSQSAGRRESEKVDRARGGRHRRLMATSVSGVLQCRRSMRSNIARMFMIEDQFVIAAWVIKVTKPTLGAQSTCRPNPRTTCPHHAMILSAPASRVPHELNSTSIPTAFNMRRCSGLRVRRAPRCGAAEPRRPDRRDLRRARAR